MNFSDNNKGAWSDLLSPTSTLVLLVLLMVMGNAIGSGITYLAGQALGLSLTDLLETFNEKSASLERNFIRAANLISHLFTFVLPAVLLTFLLNKANSYKALKLDRFPVINMLSIGILFLIAIFVLSQAAYWLNQQLPLPEWAGEMEISAERIVKGLLVMDSIWELIFTITVVAVLPAIGEELIFRGILQQSLEKITHNPILAIWFSGLIFSAFHFQFAGLLPRFLLGVGLGYLFYWTQSLWMPILAHFVINAMQIVGHFFVKEGLPETGLESINWNATLIASIMVAGMSYYLYNQFRTKIKPSIETNTDGHQDYAA
ncbi:MAG: CPBP family intramembrane metalloprotease [Chitinophagales bacterium]|nr:CPBP family intramembrane metalloprotease [Chitinophagales bacterium]